jgi:MoxR-like ATPase
LRPFPHHKELHEILDRTTQATDVSLHARLDGPQILEMRHLVRTVPVAPHVQDRVVQMVLATHPDTPGNTLAAKYIRYGSSPRGAQTLILGGKVRALLDGRFNVSIEDVRALLLPALRHRIILNFEAHADGRTPDDLLDEIAAAVWKN